MKKRTLFLGLVLLLPILVFGQEDNSGARTIKGLVIDKQTGTIPVGANILQYKTVNGAVVGPDGKFEMKVGKKDTVLIQIPFCFSSYYALYLPADDFKRIVLSKRLEKKSKKILEDWERRN